MTPVAIKLIKDDKVKFDKEFQREIATMVRIRHPNLILFMGASLVSPLCIVTELCLGDTVFNLLHELTDVRIT